jgi:hypothetical protein
MDGELPTWTLIEGYQQAGIDTFTKSDRTSLGATELDGTCQNVVMTFSTNDPDNIENISFGFGNICNSIDFSIFNNINDYKFNGNADLNYVVNPTSSTLVTNYECNASDLLELDVSTINISGDFIANNNFNLATFTAGSNTNVFTKFYIHRTALITLDMSGYTGLGGDIRFNNIATLTSVINPTSPTLITNYLGQFCALTSIDVSGLNLSGTFNLQNNTGLSSISNPSNNNTFDLYRASRCNLGYVDFTTLPNIMEVNNSSLQLFDNIMTSAEVDRILVELDAQTTNGYTGRLINIEQQTPLAPPTDGSISGYDGIAAVASLTAKFITVTTD